MPVVVPRSAWLPRGDTLPTAEWRRRHRILAVVVVAHVPALLAVGLAEGRGPVLAGGAALLPLLPLLLARVSPRRGWGALCTALALLTCSLMLVELSGGAAEADFHSFFAVALIALYQDWLISALAVGVVGLEHVGGPWLGRSSVHVGAVLATTAALLLFWHAAETARAREEAYRRRLMEGQDSVVGQLARAERMREDLLATATHEYRTPLTVIRSAAQLLQRKGDRLSAEQRDLLLDGLLRHADRLQRLVENTLAASGVPRVTCLEPVVLLDVLEQVVDVVREARPRGRQSPEVQLLVDPGVVVQADTASLRQALANLVDNGVVHARPRGVVLVTASVEREPVGEADVAVLVVANEPREDLPPDPTGLFRPWVRGDSSATRSSEGAGLGLYVARRLLEGTGASCTLDQAEGWVRAEVRLPLGAGPGLVDPGRGGQEASAATAGPLVGAPA